MGAKSLADEACGETARGDADPRGVHAVPRARASCVRSDPAGYEAAAPRSSA